VLNASGSTSRRRMLPPGIPVPRAVHGARSYGR
jgi:hypothetical protein